MSLCVALEPSGSLSSFAFVFLLASPRLSFSQDQPTNKRLRKYKAPPETSHIEVLVTRKSNGKPIANAAVIFHPIKNGKDEGNLEVKTDPEGKAIIDVIPTGSTVRVQVIANGFATFAEDYEVTEPSREICRVMCVRRRRSPPTRTTRARPQRASPAYRSRISRSPQRPHPNRCRTPSQPLGPLNCSRSAHG